MELERNDKKVELRAIGKTEIKVSSVALGCWPISGMTSLNVNDADSRKTLQAAVDCGINFFDTAFCYGRNGESENLICQVLGNQRDQIVIATKGGLHWDKHGTRISDSSPGRLKKECEESLQRLGTDYIDLLYLHAHDKSTPIEESAGALRDILTSGKIRAVGTSNLSFDELKRFHSVCELSAFQPAYNMLQREIENEIVPWCLENNVSLMVYWPLLKGLLAGKLPRDHVFQPGDGRPKYPLFQGEEWQRNQDFVDALRLIAEDANRSVAQVVVNWTIHQPGITSALCGAKRAYQIEETAGAMDWRLSSEHVTAIEAALAKRGKPASMSAV